MSTILHPNRSCIKWTNPVTGKAISVHIVVTDGVMTDLTCCNKNANPGCYTQTVVPATVPVKISPPLAYSGSVCHVSIIRYLHHYKPLFAGPLVLRKPITQDSVMNNDLGSLHTSNLLRAMTNLKAANDGSLGYIVNYHGPDGPCGASPCCPHLNSLEFLPCTMASSSAIYSSHATILGLDHK